MTYTCTILCLSFHTHSYERLHIAKICNIVEANGHTKKRSKAQEGREESKTALGLKGLFISCIAYRHIGEVSLIFPWFIQGMKLHPLFTWFFIFILENYTYRFVWIGHEIWNDFIRNLLLHYGNALKER